MKKISNKTASVFWAILLPFTVFSNSKSSFAPISLESFYFDRFNNIITLGEMEFSFGEFYGGVSIVRFFDYENAAIIEDAGGAFQAIGYYNGGSSFLPLRLGYRPINRLSINLDADILAYPYRALAGPIVSYGDIWKPYRVYGIPIKYSLDLSIKCQLLKNNNFALEWDSGVRMYGFPSLDRTSGELVFQGRTPDILNNPEALETNEYKKNVFFPYTGLKITGPSYGKDSKIPSRVLSYTIISCLHSLSTLDLGYSQNSVSGNIKYIAADCALGALTGTLEQFLHDAWVKEYDSDGSKLGKKVLIGLIGGLIWEIGTYKSWATNIAHGGGGSDYMARDMLFFGSLQAGLAFRIGLSIK